MNEVETGETGAYVVFRREDYQRLPRKVREDIEQAALKRMADEEVWIGGTEATEDDRGAWSERQRENNPMEEGA